MSEERNTRKVRQGVVVSAANDKTIVVSVAGTLICAGIVRMFTKLRVEEHDEKIGLDMSEHGESAYPSFNGLD